MVSIKLKSSAILKKEEMLISEPLRCRLNTKKPTFRIRNEVRGAQTDRPCNLECVSTGKRLFTKLSCI